MLKIKEGQIISGEVMRYDKTPVSLTMGIYSQEGIYEIDWNGPVCPRKYISLRSILKFATRSSSETILRPFWGAEIGDWIYHDFFPIIPDVEEFIKNLKPTDEKFDTSDRFWFRPMYI